QFRRPLRACRRCVARPGVAAIDGAAERRARTPRLVARAVGDRAGRRVVVGRVDSPAAMGSAMNAKAAKAGASIAKVAKLVAAFATARMIVLSPYEAFAGERYALVITGASGGDTYAQKYDAWRSSFTTTLREKFHYAPERTIVLAETESDG